MQSCVYSRLLRWCHLPSLYRYTFRLYLRTLGTQCLVTQCDIVIFLKKLAFREHSTLYQLLTYRVCRLSLSLFFSYKDYRLSPGYLTYHFINIKGCRLSNLSHLLPYKGCRLSHLSDLLPYKGCTLSHLSHLLPHKWCRLSHLSHLPPYKGCRLSHITFTDIHGVQVVLFDIYRTVSGVEYLIFHI